MYEHLNLKAWPFQIIPDEEFAKIWAGRAQTKKQLDLLVKQMQFIPKSSIYLLWANFGMGKTHTLLHLQYLCHRTKDQLIPIYVVMPNRPSGFVDLYRSIVSAFPLEILTDQLIKVSSSSSGSLIQNPLFSRSPGIVNALLAYRSGDYERMVVARQWLIAQPGLTNHDLRLIGVSHKIRTPEDAINSLTTLTRLYAYGSKTPIKLVVLLDEYQRIGELRPPIRNEINAGMTTYFNANPAGLEVFLTFAFGRQDNVFFLISDELKSRISPERINLDVFTKDQAIEFIRDLLAQFRVTKDARWSFPFSPGAINKIVETIADRKSLTPRRIMKLADHVLLTSQINRSDDRIDEITTLETAEILQSVDIESFDEGESSV